LACVEGRAARRLVSSALLALGVGCASTPPTLPAPPSFPGAAAEKDLRAAYRAAVCGRLAPDAARCDLVLRREANEPTAVQAAVPEPPVAARYRIGIVPGFFAECLEPVLKPFADAESGLRARGYDIAYFRVPGRGTAELNARHIATQISEAKADPRPWILVTYSKGLTDALELLVGNPDVAGRVAAIVSFAGAANGSPLADTLHAEYRDLIARFPIPGCASGSGEEIEDLRRDVRRAWWLRNGTLVTTPVFSVVAMASRDRVSVGSWTSYRMLSEIDPRNDSKLLWHDQLVPGGYLLGFVDADHWMIALPLAEQLPALSFLFTDDIPRAALVEGALEVAAGVLARTRPSAPPPR